jgi:hypothetical protein
MDTTFLYGAQFYRPPHPPRNIRARELGRMAREFGFNTIKLFAQWSLINRSEGFYDFEEIAEILHECTRLNLKVVINTIIENAPYWLEQRYPEAHYVDAHGHAQWLGGNSNTQSGGHPGLCLTHAGAWRHRIICELWRVHVWARQHFFCMIAGMNLIWNQSGIRWYGPTAVIPCVAIVPLHFMPFAPGCNSVMAPLLKD